MVLDIFALVVMLVLVAAVIWLVVILGPLPGRIARERNHPQADAIRVLGWIGLVTLGAAWLVALVWAYTRPFGDASLRARIAELEEEIQQLKSADPARGDAS